MKIKPVSTGVLMTYGMHCIDCLASLVHDIDIEELIEELNKVD